MAQVALTSRGDAVPVLSTLGISLSFGGIRAVQNLTLSLPEGRVVALVGPNGAGKTTLFNLLTGFLPPDTGEVFYRGRRITGLPSHAIARLGIARSFQDLRLFEGMTVLANVMMAVQQQPGERLGPLLLQPRRVRSFEANAYRQAITALEYVGLADQADTLARDLGYGQQKLLVIARLIATEGDVLLLDEPTSGLDGPALQNIITLVHSLVELGKTVCLIEHNVDVVRDLADEVIFLNEGALVAHGPTAEILGDRHLAEIYFGL